MHKKERHFLSPTLDKNQNHFTRQIPYKRDRGAFEQKPDQMKSKMDKMKQDRLQNKKRIELLEQKISVGIKSPKTMKKSPTSSNNGKLFFW